MAWFRTDGGSTYVSRETLLTNDDVSRNIKQFDIDKQQQFNVSRETFVIHSSRFNVSRETFNTMTRSAK